MNDKRTHMKAKYLAEALGTFALVFAGTGAIVVNDMAGGIVTHAGVALTFGLVIMAMIYAVGAVSGAHFNPAVSLGFWMAGRFPGRSVVPYAMSQLAGALLASGLLRLLFPAHETLGATLPAGPLGQSFVLEVVLTFFLMFVIVNVATGSKEQGIMAGAAIGATVALAALFGGPVSGASMNPARSLAPALVTATAEAQWVYLLAPAVGAWLAVWAYRGVHPAAPSDEVAHPQKPHQPKAEVMP